MQIPSAMWAFVIIGGPILLAGALLWGRLANRAERSDQARTGAATRRVYSAEDSGRPQGVPGQPSSVFLKIAVGMLLLVVVAIIVSMIFYHPNGAQGGS